MQFENVTATALANVYFDGKVVSHSLKGAQGNTKTLGLIYPGEYHFNTAAPERMEITAGMCEVTLDGQGNAARYEEGEVFEVPGNSGFVIRVDSGICQYVCSFLAI